LVNERGIAMAYTHYANMMFARHAREEGYDRTEIRTLTVDTGDVKRIKSQACILPLVYSQLPLKAV
jgi:hypothetical protein